MTTQEFSERFDSLIRTFKMQNGQYEQSILEFDEYEKSLFLTQSQDTLVLQLYRKFEQDEEVRNYLRSLVKNYKTSNRVTSNTGLSEDSIFFILPDDLMFILNSSVESQGKLTSTLPITHDEYYLQEKNPYRKFDDKHAWRIDFGNILEDKVIEIITKIPTSIFHMRYLKRPKPIILVELGDLKINEVSTKSECELSQDLHDEILNLAVQNALQASVRVKQTSNQ